MCQEYGQKMGMLRVMLFPFTPWIVVGDATVAREVLEKLHDKPEIYSIFEILTGDSILARYDIAKKSLKYF